MAISQTKLVSSIAFVGVVAGAAALTAGIVRAPFQHPDPKVLAKEESEKEIQNLIAMADGAYTALFYDLRLTRDRTRELISATNGKPVPVRERAVFGRSRMAPPQYEMINPIRNAVPITGDNVRTVGVQGGAPFQSMAMPMGAPNNQRARQAEQYLRIADEDDTRVRYQNAVAALDRSGKQWYAKMYGNGGEPMGEFNFELRHDGRGIPKNGTLDDAEDVALVRKALSAGKNQEIRTADGTVYTTRFVPAKKDCLGCHTNHKENETIAVMVYRVGNLKKPFNSRDPRVAYRNLPKQEGNQVRLDL